MASLYLESYLTSVERLPGDIRRNFTLMREMDFDVEGETAQLTKRCADFLENIGKLSVGKRDAVLSEIHETFKRLLDMGDQKVTLAVQTYETVDKHIRQLDADLKKFEQETSGSSSNKRKRQTIADPPAPTEDMPVDPNEPKYCICHQVSYGEMIGCDNPRCPTEWFHFGCVHLTVHPKGKWYCPLCVSAQNDRKKKKQT